MMTELILTKNNIEVLSLSDDTQKFSGEVVAKLAGRIIELDSENAALKSRLSDLENGRPIEESAFFNNTMQRAINAITIADPIDSAVDWYIDNNGDINAAHQAEPISTEERLAVIAHALADDVINLLYLLETEKSRLADLENGRPMETAPKDGTHILVEFKDKFGTYFDVIEWPGSYDKWVSDMPDTYDEDLLRWWPLPGSQK